MDYYQTLGVNRNASQDEIKKAYRKLASKHHPDKGGDKQKFQEIEEAYRTLSDDQKRAEYDNPQPQFSHHFGGFDPQDIFSQMFGGPHFGQGFGRQQPRKNKSVTLTIQMTLQEVLTGKEVLGTIRLPSGKEQAINLNIPAGVDSGDQIKYSGLGDDSIPGIPKGDIIAQIHVMPDYRFQRQGPNLLVEETVSIFDAILGSKIKVKTLENKTIELTIPEGTKPDTILSCSGQGLPYKNNRARGNLFVRIKFNMPEKLADTDKQQLEILRKKYSL